MAYCSMEDCKKYGLFEDAKERYENTSRRWKNAWWDVICEIWESFERWQEKYTLDRIAKTIIKKIAKRCRATRSREDIIDRVCVTFAKGTKVCYLFKFYDEYDNIIYSKVGTTEDSFRKRISSELRSYRKNGDPIKYATIESVIDTSHYCPEGAESQARAYFIKKFNGNFIKNDRFTCNIDVNEFNEVVNNYLAAA